MAKISAAKAPDVAATRRPRVALPVTAAAANPNTAPISIMPSIPKLRTPDRSQMSSPVAANIKGVAAVIIVMMEARMSSVIVEPFVWMAGRFCNA